MKISMDADGNVVISSVNPTEAKKILAKICDSPAPDFEDKNELKCDDVSKYCSEITSILFKPEFVKQCSS